MLRGLVDIRRGEGRNAFAAFFTLLGLTSGHTLMETARDALFLARVPASHLAWMYLLIALAALGLAQLQKKGARADSKGTIAAALVAAAMVTAGFYALAASPRSWLLYVLYIWSGLAGSWITLQVWTLLGRIHDARQAKRLYGFIGTGSVLGAVLGAAFARALTGTYPARFALLASGTMLVASVLPLMMLVTPAEEPSASALPDSEREAERSRGSLMSGMRVLWQNAFARRVLGIVLISTVTVTLADFLFKSVVASEVPKERLASYFATFYAVTNALALAAQVALATWVFRTFGVQRALFFFPALLLLASGGVIATGGALLAAVGLKALDGTLRYSLHKTSNELLLVPVPDGTRERVKPIIDLVGTRGGQAVASLVILLAAAVGARPWSTAPAVLLLAALWLGLVVTMRRLYLDVFRSTLKSGGLTGKAELPELDMGALELLFGMLNSSRDPEVLAALELMAEQRKERLIPALILYHPSKDVVLRSLDIFTRMGRTDFVSIADRLNTHPDGEVSAAALRARTSVAPDRALLEKRLEDPNPQVSVTALVALVARGWMDQGEIRRRFEERLTGASWETHAELARAIRDVARRADDGGGGPSDIEEARQEKFDAGLERLAAHEDARVKLEAASAMAVRGCPRFLPLLTAMLAPHETRSAARSALREIRGALDYIDGALQERSLPRDVLTHLPRVISTFDPQPAAAVLLEHLVEAGDGVLRYKILRELVKLRRRHPKLTLDDAKLQAMVDATLAHALELGRWREVLESDADLPPSSQKYVDPLQAAHHLLHEMVRDKEVHTTQRLFLLLELVHREDFEGIYRGLRGKNPKVRASSLELIENLLRSPRRERVLAIVGEPSAGARAEPPLEYEEVLRQILSRVDGTLKTLAEYRAVEIGLDVGSPASPASVDLAALRSTLGERLLVRARDLMEKELFVEGGKRATV